MKVSRLIAVMAFIAVSMAFGPVFAIDPGAAHGIFSQFSSPDALGTAAMGVMALGAMGEISLVEVKSLIEKQGTAWEEFKKTNDELIKAKADGKAVADLEAKLAKMETDLNEAGVSLKEIAAKANRPTFSAESAEKAEKSLERFNAVMKAAATEAGKAFNPLTIDQYVAYKDAVVSYIRFGDKLTPDQQKAINVGTASQGGFLVGQEMEATIDRVVHRYSAMRTLARVIPIGAASYKKLVKVSGTSGGTRVGEQTAATQGTSPGWVELEFRPGTYLSDQRISLESLEDSVQDVESDLMEEIGIEFAEMEGSDFITGDGVNGPRGIQSYTMVDNDSYAWGSTGFIVSGAAAAFAATNPSDALIKLQHGLKRQYRANASWTMNDATLGTIRRFKDGQGIYLWAPTGLMQGAVGQLLGHPVMTDDFMPDLAANAFPVAFADFKRAYYIVDRKGMTVLRDPYSAHPNVKFVGRRRVGGGIANFEAVKFLKCST